MEASVVVPVDPAGGRVLDVREGAVGGGVEHGGADAFRFEQAVHGLHEGVVVGVAHGSDRRGDAFEGEVLGQANRCVLGGADVAMQRLVAAKVARDERALRSSCGVSPDDELPVEGLAVYCRKNKVPAALAVADGLAKEGASKISSIDALLTALEERARK